MTVSPGPPGRQAEQQLVMAALAELIDRFGAEQLQDPGRVRSLLSDQLGTEAVRCRRELNLVVSAAEAKVPAALLNDIPRSLDGLASRLATQTGLGLPAAYWAVLAWAAPLSYAGTVDRPASPFLAATTATTSSPKATTTPTASTIAPPPARLGGPRPGVVALAGLLVILLVGVGTVLTVRNQSSRPATPPAEQPADPAPSPIASPTAAIDTTCQVELPATGEGSAEGMTDDPIATAASNNPALTTFVSAVQQAGLVDTLNGLEAATVFAPTNDAFAEMSTEDLNAVLADQEKLTSMLMLHVIQGQELDAQALAGMDSATTASGETITLAAQSATLTVNSQARVICPNVKTANATMHMIDTVIMPKS